MTRGTRLVFVTHPEVVIDPTVPVPRWPLSALGRRRMTEFANRLADAGVNAVWSSDEQKALDGAVILAETLRVPQHVDAGLGENGRESTGYIAPPEFWEVVAEFFAHPDRSVRGWEAASDAQRRIVAAVGRVSAAAGEGITVIVSHGGVGRLLRAHLQGVPIGQEHAPSNPGGGRAAGVTSRTGRRPSDV
jgi:broad specificity phosphatase PhoE